MSSPAQADKNQDVIYLDTDDLPVYCPGPKAPLWSMHPRIYIEVALNKIAVCQYCGAKYALREGQKQPSHHSEALGVYPHPR